MLRSITCTNYINMESLHKIGKSVKSPAEMRAACARVRIASAQANVVELQSQVSGRAHARHHRRALDHPDPARSLSRRAAQVSGFRAVAHRDQRNNAVRPAEEAGRAMESLRAGSTRITRRAPNTCSTGQGPHARADHEEACWSGARRTPGEAHGSARYPQSSRARRRAGRSRRPARRSPTAESGRARRAPRRAAQWRGKRRAPRWRSRSPSRIARSAKARRSVRSGT